MSCLIEQIEVMRESVDQPAPWMRSGGRGKGDDDFEDFDGDGFA